MNKYQEALDRISEGTTIQHFATTDEDGYSNFDDYEEYIKPDESDIATLQELVDKATPKKPIGIDTTVSWFTSGICECGNAVFMFDMNGDLDYKFCNKCGQALDWSEDEPTK